MTAASRQRFERGAAMAGFAGAFLWVVGLFLSAEAGLVLPSDAEYFWVGIVGGGLGLLLIPIAVVAAEDRSVRALGVALSVATAASGIALALGATGGLGKTAPGWIVPASGASSLAVLAWMSVVSYRGRHTDHLGRTVFSAGVLTAAALPIGIVVWVSPYTHTNGTEAIDAVMGLVVFASVPFWLVCVSVRLWTRHRPKVLDQDGQVISQHI